MSIVGIVVLVMIGIAFCKDPGGTLAALFSLACVYLVGALIVCGFVGFVLWSIAQALGLA